MKSLKFNFKIQQCQTDEEIKLYDLSDDTGYKNEFDSDERIKKAIVHIDEKLFVSEMQCATTVGSQKSVMNEYELSRFCMVMKKQDTESSLKKWHKKKPDF